VKACKPSSSMMACFLLRPNQHEKIDGNFFESNFRLAHTGIVNFSNMTDRFGGIAVIHI
jgi:hypothetical protein